MPEHQRPDIVNRLRKKFALKGPGEIATISPEIVPVVIVEETLSDIADERLYYGGISVPAVAAEFGAFTLTNPLGSGVVALPSVTHFFLPTQSATVKAGIASAYSLPSSTAAPAADARFALTQRAASKITWDNVAGAPPTIGSAPYFQVRTNTSGNYEFDLEGIVLPPGTSFALVSTTAQTELVFVIRWRERAHVAEDVR